MISLLKKYKLIIISLIILAGIVAVLYPIYRNAQAEYISEEFGFKFDYPKYRWEKTDSKEINSLNERRKKSGSVMQAAVKKRFGKETFFGIVVQSAAGATQFNRDDSIRQLDAANIGLYGNFEKLGAEKIDFLGYDAIDYQFKYKDILGDKDQKDYHHERQVIFLANETVYRLICFSTPEGYKANQKDFDRILESFEFTD